MPSTKTRQPRRTDRRPTHTARRAPAAPARPTAEQRVRAEGGPQDSAHYRCGCGNAFAGAVSTHVACPRCGADQDW